MHPRGLVRFMSLLLCFGAMEFPVYSQLPAPVPMNPDAGRGSLLTVVVRLVNGQKVPLVVDTGSPVTAFENELAPQLGERLYTGTLINFGVPQAAGVYAAPALYLGKVPLQMGGTNVVTFGRRKLADQGWPGLMGFLGMDVLQHYCLQLDFTAGKLRFLDDHHADKKNWGTPFPLTDIGDGCFVINDNLAGVKGQSSVVDTGCNASGWLQPGLYRQWTNQVSAADAKIHSPDGTLGGETYHDLDLRVLAAKPQTNDDHIKFNGIGLRALAENLVTLDFPHRTLYLKHLDDWPLPARDAEVALKSAENSSLKSLKHLLKRGQLPGISRHDHGKTIAFRLDHADSPYLDTGTWDLLKNGDTTNYHCSLARTSKHGPWKLQKAWRTDQNGHTLEIYPLP